jgi:hypothetical protein
MTARTRLGADDLMLALDEALTSPFDPMREIKHIKIARWLAPDNLTSDELQLKRTSPNTFLLLEFAYEYGRFGLKQLPAELP